MNSLAAMMFYNALLAALFALLVAVGSKLWRRPTVTHFLWALVLLKLITPFVDNRRHDVWTRVRPLHKERAFGDDLANPLMAACVTTLTAPGASAKRLSRQKTA